MKALVVDDSAVMRRILIGALSRAGIGEAAEAANGEEAVAAVRAGEYALILLDWNMPKMSGLQALKEIRSRGCRVPVIMVTTEAEKGRVIEALKAGANDYLIKPFQPDVIVLKIKDTLARAEQNV